VLSLLELLALPTVAKEATQKLVRRVVHGGGEGPFTRTGGAWQSDSSGSVSSASRARVSSLASPGLSSSSSSSSGLAFKAGRRLPAAVLGVRGTAAALGVRG